MHTSKQNPRNGVTRIWIYFKKNQRKALMMLMDEAKKSLGLVSLDVDWHSGISDEQV